jgi:hypothetical protein
METTTPSLLGPSNGSTQRRHQEEGGRRKPGQQGARVAAQGGVGPRRCPQLPRPQGGKGDPVRRLRRGRQPEVRLGRCRRRHRGVRRGDHQAVGHGGLAHLPPGEPAAHHRRRRGIQRVPQPAVEPGAWIPGRAHRAGGHRLPPPAWHQQVEPHRAPPVQPHLHELARPAAGQPRGRGTAHRDDHHPNGPEGLGRTRPGLLPTGIKVTDAELGAMPLTRHAFHGGGILGGDNRSADARRLPARDGGRQ